MSIRNEKFKINLISERKNKEVDAKKNNRIIKIGDNEADLQEREEKW